MANSICLAEATAQNAAALTNNGGGGSLKEIADILRCHNSGIPQDGSTTYLPRFISAKDEGKTPYPSENPIIFIIGPGDISFCIGELEDAAYCLTGLDSYSVYGDLLEWKKGVQFYTANCVEGTSNIAIYDAQDRLIRLLEITNSGSSMSREAGDPGTPDYEYNCGCLIRDYKTANY